MKNKVSDMYRSQEIGLDGLVKAIGKGWISAEEAVDLVGEEKSFELLQKAKLAEISASCNGIIVHGIDLEFGGEAVHFNLSIEDQSNIANLFRVEIGRAHV